MGAGLSAVEQAIFSTDRLGLFLDYDGTLAEFAPNPDVVLPDPQVIECVARLASLPAMKVTVLSGRRLDHIERLVPLPGVWLAGSYGLENRLPDGSRLHRLPIDSIRPMVEALKPRVQALLAGREGFYLEDKGWSLAVHARFARADEADSVLPAVRALFYSAAGDDLRILDSHRFIEIAPSLGDKGHSVEWLVEQQELEGFPLLYIGDDDKDEEAFRVINARGGRAILVAPQERPTAAHARLADPRQVLAWLDRLYRAFRDRSHRAAW